MMGLSDGRKKFSDTISRSDTIPAVTDRQPATQPAGEDHRPLATSGSTRSRRMPTPYRYLRCGDLRSPAGSWSGATVHSDYSTTMMMILAWCTDTKICDYLKKTIYSMTAKQQTCSSIRYNAIQLSDFRMSSKADSALGTEQPEKQRESTQ